jgi:hypothetical protein
VCVAFVKLVYFHAYLSLSAVDFAYFANNCKLLANPSPELLCSSFSSVRSLLARSLDNWVGVILLFGDGSDDRRID